MEPIRTVEASRSRVDAYADQIESLWAIWDQLLPQVEPDRWGRRYGPDWTFADVPFHIAYFDRIEVANVIEKSDRLPAEERWRARRLRELNDWNAREFAQRPSGQTPDQSIQQMLAERERICGIMAGLTDRDLGRPAFNHVMGGWSTIEKALVRCRQHHWSEVFEFGYRLTGQPPQFRPDVSHSGIDFYMRLLSAFADPDQVAKTESFTTTWEIGGPGGGAWTHRVGGGKVTVEQGRAEQPDLRLRMKSPTYFLLMFKAIKNPMLLMLTGSIRIKGLRNFGRFVKLFAKPDLEREFGEISL